MVSKIKAFLWVHKKDILTLAILALTVLAAFQLGRLSILYSGNSELQIVEVGT